MDNPTLIRLLSGARPTRLKLVELMEDLRLPSGSLDLAAAVERQTEINDANAQAQQYVASTKRLTSVIRRCLLQ